MPLEQANVSAILCRSRSAVRGGRGHELGGRCRHHPGATERGDCPIAVMTAFARGVYEEVEP